MVEFCVCVCWRECRDRVGVGDALKPHCSRWKLLISSKHILFYVVE